MAGRLVDRDRELSETVPVIATLVRLADVKAAIVSARAECVVRDHCDVAGLLATLRRGACALVVVDVADHDGRSMAPAVAAIRREFPRLPVLVYCAVAPGTSPVILAAVRAGASGLIFRGVDDVAQVLRAAFRSAGQSLVSQRIADAVADLLPAGIRPLLRYALSRTGEGVSVDDAAEVIGVDRKTLRNRLSKASIGPAEFVNWIRLGLVVGTLGDGSRTVERVALDNGFASGTSFRNMLRRYTSLTATELRGDEGFDAFLTLLRGRLRRATPVLALAGDEGTSALRNNRVDERRA
jgi:DNA-binding NarL/FixJ family response regulator